MFHILAFYPLLLLFFMTKGTATSTTLNGQSANDQFGYMVSMSGSTLLVSAPDRSSYQGSAYIYYGCTSPASTSCTDSNRKELRGTTLSYFGTGISIDGTTVVVGAYGTNSYQGATYIYYGCSSLSSTTCQDANRITLPGVKGSHAVCIIKHTHTYIHIFIED